MRAVVMRNAKLVVEDVPSPIPEQGEVLVKTLACGICGSDLHTLDFAHKIAEAAQGADASEGTNVPDSMDMSGDVIMGHEFCAEVLAHGPGTTGQIKVGTRVCSVPILPRQSGVTAIGYSSEVPGGYSEQMVLSEPMLLEVPNGLSSEMAALTEPMAVGCHAVEMARLKGDELPLVIGCGPVGLAVIAALKLKGIGPIVASDYSSARRQLAETMGADIIVDPSKSSPYEKWSELATHGVDGETLPPDFLTGMPGLRTGVYFECVGVPGIINQMMAGSKQGGRIVVVGVCMEEDTFTPMNGITGELNIQFALGYTPEEFTATLFKIAEGEILAEPMITGTVDIDGVPKAFKDLADPEQHAKIIVKP
ncbi:MAG: zinc-binding dehydrogenase [Gammaproteobacteria bacterium]|nr:zinc-binding dehydrogenase [Gammaproteobacteria bacterium]MBT4493835.1 zinc-binding dehydrogenase [Gammaproteobacteria bacterium]